MINNPTRIIYHEREKWKGIVWNNSCPVVPALFWWVQWDGAGTYRRIQAGSGAERKCKQNIVTSNCEFPVEKLWLFLMTESLAPSTFWMGRWMGGCVDCNIQDGRKSNTASTVEKNKAKGIQKLVNAAIPRFLITRERSTKKQDWLLSLVFPEAVTPKGSLE